MILGLALVAVAVGCGRPTEEPGAETPVAVGQAETATAAVTAVPTPTGEVTEAPTQEDGVSTAIPTASPTATEVASTTEPTASPTRRPIPLTTQTPEVRRTPTLEPEPVVYDPNQNMFAIYSGFGHSRELTLRSMERARREGDKSQVNVILEAILFLGRDAALDAIDVVKELTGQNFGLDLRGWREWLGPRLDEYAPPSDYPRWKAQVLSLIDPPMGALIEQAVEGGSRANLTEIVWGGVRLDGIPPLEFPTHVTPEEAEYLEGDDRVFGVSINGEHRAYPLRVMNAHELANDELGGEPISLVY